MDEEAPAEWRGLLRLREHGGSGQQRELTPDAARPGLKVAEVLLRAAARGAEAGAREAVKRAADAVADWLKGRAA